ncbi:MAG: hypothetical protein ACYTFH_03530 [Planctomycetota bacterium]
MTPPRLRIFASTLALAMGSLLHAQQCGTGGSCLEPTFGGGCEDLACCETVCGLDPFCCSESWDADCVALANELCIGLCGAAVNGPCDLANGTPACDDAECCETVCALDAFCCEAAWDTTCALLAGFNCKTGGPGTCGDPGAGSCDTPHPTGACDDEVCCESVCGIDPTCCSASWDAFCVALASKFCVDGCTVECGADAAAEAEACGERLNDPCVFGTPKAIPEAIAVGVDLCGRLDVDETLGADVDVFEIEIPNLGAGETRVDLSFEAAIPSFAVLVAVDAGACGELDDAPLLVASDLCAPASASACLEPGLWRVIVAPGTPDAIGGDLVACDLGVYRLRVDASSACVDACAVSTDPCGATHAAPGCEDPECCASVCEADPVCCASAWDGVCVELAESLCTLEPPANDVCNDAVEIPLGSTPFTTRLATTDGEELPPACDEGFGLGLDADVWFLHVAECEGFLRVQTCGFDAFDTRIAVYSGDCADGEVVACNDQAPLCTPAGASRLLAPVVCGETYLIRVGGFKGDTGEATLTLDCFDGPCPPPCPADLDGDGSVGGADLAILLADWGDGSGSGTSSDLDGDGTVGGADLAVLLAAWGSCP